MAESERRISRSRSKDGRSAHRRSKNVVEERLHQQGEHRNQSALSLPPTDWRQTKRSVSVVIESLLVSAKRGHILLVNSSLKPDQVGFTVTALEKWKGWFARVALCRTFASLKVYEATVPAELSFVLERAKISPHLLAAGERYHLKKNEVLVCAMGDVQLSCESRAHAAYFGADSWYGLTITTSDQAKAGGKVFTAILNEHKDITTTK
jgi:hypothetical protein